MIGVLYKQNMYDYKGYFIVHENNIIHPRRVTVGGSGVNFFCSNPDKFGRIFLKLCIEDFEKQLIPNVKMNQYEEYLI